MPRLSFPAMICSAQKVMASMCQFGRNSSPGETVANTFRRNTEKSFDKISSRYLRRPAGLSLVIRVRFQFLYIFRSGGSSAHLLPTSEQVCENAFIRCAQ